jgi:hypothetical protein
MGKTAKKKTQAAAKPKPTPKAKSKPAPTPKSAPQTIVAKSAKLGASPAARTVKALFAKLPPIDAATRAAFRSLATDAQRSELGTRTRALDVLADSVRMAVAIADALATLPELADEYTRPRFAYFLEAILALDARLAVEASKSGKLGLTRASAATGREAAVAVRTRLYKRLLRFGGRRVPLRNALKTAYGTAATPLELQQSLARLADLADGYLALKDDSSRILAVNAGLTPTLVASARDAAEQATVTAADATLGGRARVTDSPLVNMNEGNVLLEMAHAMDVFDDASEEIAGVQRLTVTSGSIRRVVEGHRHASSGEAPAPPAAPGPAPSPTAPAPSPSA